jgi:hypothetical protein
MAVLIVVAVYNPLTATPLRSACYLPPCTAGRGTDQREDKPPSSRVGSGGLLGDQTKFCIQNQHVR